MPRGLGPELTQAELTALRYPWPAGGCPSEVVQRLEDDMPDIRRGSGAVWPRQRSQYHGHVQGVQHRGDSGRLAYTLQAGEDNRAEQWAGPVDLQ